MIIRGLVSLTALVSCASAPAQVSRRDAAKIVDELMQCRSIADAEQRLACFDQGTQILADARAKKDIVVLDREEVKKTERSLFGFSLPKLSLFGSDEEGDKDRDEDKEIDQIESTISSVASAGYGKWVLNLADGSSWQTTEMNTSIDPKKGQAIRIEKAALGSFRASIAGQKLLRIKRVG